MAYRKKPGKDKAPHVAGIGATNVPEEDLGIAGRVARSFINSPLSPLLFMAMLFLGLVGLAITPRQEDPQISVPMVDILVSYPGTSAEQVASLAVDPLERIMSEIPGVEHVYSASQRGQGIVTVQFYVGEPLGPSIVKVHDKIQSNLDKIPPGVSPPLVKPKGIDDVPVVTLTLWSLDVDDGSLRKLALDILQSLKEIPNTGQGFIVGGRTDQVRVEVRPERLSGYEVSLDQVATTIRTANAERQAGNVESADTHFRVYTGSFLRTADEISRLVVGTRKGSPIYVRDVADVVREPQETSRIVEYYTAPAGKHTEQAPGLPAVTIAVAKKEGSNGVEVAKAILAKVEALKDVESGIIPGNVHVATTRNYGKTADDKVNELIFKLFVATGAVFVLVLLAFRALRPAMVVLLVIPVVILFTVFAAYVMHYTIDRVSLFALIFSIGILVDDAIVVVENIYRRWLAKGTTDTETAVDAVREVGNPTIIATLTVIAALLPMGFVRGMMGPYMEPIPALGSVAMLFSLLAAFMFTPWWAMRLKPTMAYLERAEKREHKGTQRLDRFFRRTLIPLIEHPRKRRLFNLALWAALIFSCSMFYTTWVTVKMLPLDNKPEFSVVVNLPEGTALPVTANLARRIAETIRDDVPEVTALQTYVGTARPFDFNGMVRHYYLRKQPWQAEVQVQLTHKSKRHQSSHELAVIARGLINDRNSALGAMVERSGARVAVVEMPPGPPVLQTVVAEVHGPTAESRRRFAYDMTGLFERAENIGDVDNYLESPYYYWRFEVDTEKAVRRGISVDTINRNVSMAMGNFKLGDIKQGRVLEPTHIVIHVPLAQRAQIARLGDLPIPTAAGGTVPLAELGRFVRVREDHTIFHKDLRPVEYVTGESVGRLAAPIYGMLQVQDLLEADAERTGYPVRGTFTAPPESDDGLGWEWAGEWTVTYETFRDMGIAFAMALILIYILVVWEFGNFRVPALIMAPIPLTLLGIIPGHWLAGAEFTATSMIGWIALAGIIVRNSILLVDFSIHAIRAGMTPQEAVIQACTTRTRPIVITALALMAGSSVIITDPIFKGMAISLFSGVLVSTVLTLVVIPLACMGAVNSLNQLALGGGSGGAAPESIPEPPAAPSAPPATARPIAAAGLFARLKGGATMLLYLIQGLFNLVWLGLKGRLERRRAGGERPAPRDTHARQAARRAALPLPSPEASPATAEKAGAPRTRPATSRAAAKATPAKVTRPKAAPAKPTRAAKKSAAQSPARRKPRATPDRSATPPAQAPALPAAPERRASPAPRRRVEPSAPPVPSNGDGNGSSPPRRRHDSPHALTEGQEGAAEPPEATEASKPVPRKRRGIRLKTGLDDNRPPAGG